MERITDNHLDYQIGILNAHFGIDTGTSVEWNTVGRFYVQGAYGGFQLERIVNEGGGCADISKRGTRREIYEQLMVLNEGLRLFKDTDTRWLRSKLSNEMEVK